MNSTALNTNKYTNWKLQLLFVLILNSLVLSTIFADDNLLKNGSFEEPNLQKSELPLFWNLNTSSNENNVFRISDAQSGKYAIKIISDNTGSKTNKVGIISDTVNIDYGLYILKGWYKSNGNTNAVVKYTLLDTLGNLAEEITKELLPSKEWKEFSIPISVWRNYRKKFRYKAGKINIALLNYKNGAVYYDNISLVKSDDPIVLRLFPAEFGRDYKLPVIKKSPNYFRLMLIGDKNKITNVAEIELDLPEGTDDYGVFNGGETVLIEKKKFRRFHISIPKKQIDLMEEKTGHASVTCWFNFDKIGDNRKLYYRVAIDGKVFTTKEASIKMLPPLPNGPLPKRFRRVVNWATFGSTYKGTVVDNSYMPEKIYPEVYNLVRKMGINTHLIYNTDEPTGWRKYVFTQIKKDDGEIWANIPPGFIEKFSSKLGWETKVINGGVQGIAEMCGDYYIKMKPIADVIHYDFEPPNAEKNPLWDDIPTKKMFAKMYGYNFSKLTKERLQGKLRQQWMMFRTWQIGEALRLWAKYVHSINPDWELTVSQGNGNPNKHVHYWVYNDIPNITHMPQIYTRSPMFVTRTIISLKNRYPTVKFFPYISSMVVADKGWSAVSPIYSKFISMAMLGCVGGAQWPDIRRGYDMEYIWETSRAMRDIAYLEDYVYNGNIYDNIDIIAVNSEENWEENSFSRAYELNGKILVAFNNMHETKYAKVKVSLGGISGDGWYVRNPVTGESIHSPSGNSWSSDELNKNLVYSVPKNTLGMLLIYRK